MLRCTVCQQPYPDSGLPYSCPACGAIYDFDSPPAFDPGEIEKDQPGIFRYRHSFELFPQAPTVSLGEGNTPLLWDKINNTQVGLKMESSNPSGSYKDRGTAVLVSQLLARGVTEAVEDSSGNAGASFAAYTARVGLHARVFVPESASGPKRQQIEMYGAELVRIPGPRSAAAQAVLNEVKQGAIYASHAYLPFGIPGIATIAYEIWEEMGGAPGTIIAPVGHGGLLLGLLRGFSALRQKGLIMAEPYAVGVQARACAPLWAAFKNGLGAMDTISEGNTIAEGVRVRRPSRAQVILEYILPGRGQISAVEEDRIISAYHDLSRRGFYVEPTSALVWSPLCDMIGKVPEPIILIISGSGLKYIQN